MRVYRIENNDGIGMYFAPGFRHDYKTHGHLQNSRNAPDPRMDHFIEGTFAMAAKWLNSNQEAGRFAFPSLQAAVNWVLPDWLSDKDRKLVISDMKEAGLRLSEIETTPVFTSAKQVIYSSQDAQMTGVVPLDTLLAMRAEPENGGREIPF